MFRLRSRKLSREVHPQEAVEEDYHEELLGSQLEKELNRSIEKMREDEELTASPPGSGSQVEGNLSFDLEEPCGSPLLASLAYVPGSPEEVLEDIEMPTLCSVSHWESTDLVSLSFSSASPPKVIRDKRKASQDAMTSFPSSQDVAAEEKDICEKVAALSKNSPTHVKTLVDIEEVFSGGYSVASGNEEDICNLTSSPIAPAESRMTLGAGIELLDIGIINDSLLTRSILNCQTPGENISRTSRIQREKDASEMVETGAGGQNETLSSSGILCEAGRILEELELATTINSSDYSHADRYTVPSLDLDNITDDLLSSLSLFLSPAKKIQEDTDGEEVEVKNELLEKDPAETHRPNIPFDCDMNKSLEEPGTPHATDAKKLLEEPGTPHATDAKKSLEEPNNPHATEAKKLLEEPHNTHATEAKKLLEEPHNTHATDAKTSLEGPNNSHGTNAKIEDARENKSLSKVNCQMFKHLNETFEKCLEKPCEASAQNNTFTMNNVCCNITFDRKGGTNSSFGINTTFDKELEGNICSAANTFVKKPSDSEKNNLNVTFEKGGEYKIPDLNETVNLMDAEGAVLQLILDSTPKKPTRSSLGNTSTPKSITGSSQPVLKGTITMDPNKTFFRRSLGGKLEGVAQENSMQAGQTNPLPPILGFKLGDVGQQAVASQLRRLQGGGLPTRSGPMKAIPLKSMTTSLALIGKSGSSDTPESCEGTRTTNKDASEVINSGSGLVLLGRHPDPSSCGGLGSFEAERPGTPDMGSTVAGIFTPDICSSGPRITSTPTMKSEGPFCMLGMDGPLLTPISRCRIVSTVSSDASLPETRTVDNHTSEGSAKQFGEGGTTSLPAEQPVAPDNDPDTYTHWQSPVLNQQQEGVASGSIQNRVEVGSNSTAVIQNIEDVDTVMKEAIPVASDKIESNVEDDSLSQEKDIIKVHLSIEDSPHISSVCEEREHNLAQNITKEQELVIKVQAHNPNELNVNEKEIASVECLNQQQTKFSTSKFKSTSSDENDKENRRRKSRTVTSNQIVAKTKSEANSLQGKRLPSPRIVLKQSDSNVKKPTVKSLPTVSKVTTVGTNVKQRSSLKPMRNSQFTLTKNVVETKSALPTAKTCSTIATQLPKPSQHEGAPNSSKLPSKFTSKIQSSSRLKQPIGTLKYSSAQESQSTMPVRGLRSALPKPSSESLHKPSLLRAPKSVGK